MEIAAPLSDAQSSTDIGSISGTVQLTERDLLAAQRLHFCSGLKTGKVRLRFAALMGITALAFALFVALVSGPSRIGQTLFVLLLVTPLVTTVVLSVVYLLAIPWNAHRAYAQHKSLRTPYIYTIADDALFLTGEAGSARVPWRDIHMIRENDSLVLVYEWEELYRLLPKRCIPSDHLHELRRRARERSEVFEGG